MLFADINSIKKNAIIFKLYIIKGARNIYIQILVLKKVYKVFIFADDNNNKCILRNKTAY